VQLRGVNVSEDSVSSFLIVEGKTERVKNKSYIWEKRQGRIYGRKKISEERVRGDNVAEIR
jgi:hypothetical protein